ncbi:unnamed protein product [Caenorhabditis bovis]|uniref:HTH psq-type domain-containing protein n=1 Tax=Caenorhabditis bovis TaxID=2654633 RepID=A0A8S1FBZ2_9PELO|nr:unnamed protein product [Caenorhabditis bovis]
MSLEEQANLVSSSLQLPPLLTEHLKLPPRTTEATLPNATDIMNRLSIANILNNSPSIPQMPLSFETQKMLLERQLVCPPMPFIQLPAFNALLQLPNNPIHNQYISPFAQKPLFENPLDLSNKANALLQQFAMNGFKPMELPPKPLDDSSSRAIRRNYTAEDLTQAVEDIRRGKLGTRRASVVYGIPRSTLRNKIYKLEAEGSYSPQAKSKRGWTKSTTENNLSKSTASDTPSSSPLISQSPSSPDSTNSFLDVNPVKAELTAASEEVNGGAWIDALWQNLFKNQNTQMTPDVMVVQQPIAIKPEIKPPPPRTSNEEWKRSRPKRGQYRKYDKHALDEAVKSVRRGEMSVHRAGSYYGVPHSTLEYKVKERNLMRKKKENAPSEEPTSSTFSSEELLKAFNPLHLIPLISQ